jgi:hypothetical protein
MSSVQFHEWLIRETQRRMDGCSVAETTALRQLKSAYEGLQEAKSQEAPELDAADMPRGEYLGIVRDRATTADLDELEVWVDVWLAKMGLEMSVGGDGAPLLARA